MLYYKNLDKLIIGPKLALKSLYLSRFPDVLSGDARPCGMWFAFCLFVGRWNPVWLPPFFRAWAWHTSQGQWIALQSSSESNREHHTKSVEQAMSLSRKYNLLWRAYHHEAGPWMRIAWQNNPYRALISFVLSYLTRCYLVLQTDIWGSFSAWRRPRLPFWLALTHDMQKNLSPSQSASSILLYNKDDLSHESSSSATCPCITDHKSNQYICRASRCSQHIRRYLVISELSSFNS